VLISSSSTYRRNFFLLRTSYSSASTAKESRTFPSRSARSRAWRGFESGRSNALTRGVRIEDAPQLSAFQQRIQNLRCQPTSFRLAAYLIEDCLQRRVLAGSKLAKPQTQQSLNLLFFLRRGGIVSARRLRVKRNGNRRVRHSRNPLSLIIVRQKG